MLVTAPDGRRLGFDPKDGKFHEEIESGRADLISGGLGKDMPNYFVPAAQNGAAYKVTFSGRHLTEESTPDFTYSAPGFTVGFKDVKLDPNETLTASITPDGEHVSFTASADGETPDIYFAFDPKDGTGASYTAQVGGVELEAGKTMTADFDFENGKLQFKNDDGNRDAYDVELTRLNADGTEQHFEQKDLEMGADNYEMDFENWNGTGAIPFKADRDGEGFDDETATLEANEAQPDGAEEPAGNVVAGREAPAADDKEAPAPEAAPEVAPAPEALPEAAPEATPEAEPEAAPEADNGA